MSRYTVEVRSATATDEEATIGYDRPLRTFFLTAFPDPDTDAVSLWLGGFLEEYPTLEGIILAARSQGFEISGLSHADMIAMMKEAGQPASPSIAEIHGLLR
ncbi:MULTISPECIES: hypothetical protein [Agrobacterium]|uniref:Uncharacterized protein n=1 Tax=Agrobacterium larrymoorei TaxID=160699 RepID=A0ABX8TC33_9HYPH|nr:hypothetical protein [Agrobacterium larrymoorei]NSZ10087.1 hypothetical protein [Agrobacterium tumefaciens]QYA10817.1 hypothetical protein J5285_26040 [Agrobacterium larrymoorei]